MYNFIIPCSLSHINLQYQNFATLAPVQCKDNPDIYSLPRLACAWQYFGTLIFELFFEIIRFYMDNIRQALL